MWEVFLEEVPFELLPAGQLSKQARLGPMDEGIAKVRLSFAEGQEGGLGSGGWDPGKGHRSSTDSSLSRTQSSLCEMYMMLVS